MKKKSSKKSAKAANTKHTLVNMITLPKLRGGEIYKGLIVDETGKPLRHIIELVGAPVNKPWAEACALAKQKGYALPDRRESALLRASDPRGQSGLFWTSEQYEGYADYAWAQLFGNGLQSSYRKGYEFRVRLVRSELIR